MYMGDFFTNFSIDNFKLNVFKGEAVMQNLIFNQKILAGLNAPVRLKFGMLGKLHITVPSFVKITTHGIKIKISNVFLCFEPLGMGEWKTENVVKAY